MQGFDFIEFALLFGSYAEDRAMGVSDVDIGIFTNRDISLLEHGFVTGRTEEITGKKVDIIILNDLYKNNPVLAFEIVSKGRLLFANNKDAFIDFKTNTYLNYLDSAYLREMIDKSFRKRIESGRIAERNYVGEN